MISRLGLRRTFQRPSSRLSLWAARSKRAACASHGFVSCSRSTVFIRFSAIMAMITGVPVARAGYVHLAKRKANSESIVRAEGVGKGPQVRGLWRRRKAVPREPQPSVLFLRDIDKAGEPSFSRNAGSDYKEFLLAFVGLVAFNLAQGRFSGCARSAAAFGNGGHVRGHVFAHQQSQTALRNDTFVVVSRHEKEEADRTADGDFVVRQRPGYGNGIGKEQAPAGLQ